MDRQVEIFHKRREVPPSNHPVGNTTATTVWGNVFKKLGRVTHLGMGINTNGVYTVGHVHTKLVALSKRMQTLTHSGVFLGGIDAEAGIDLFLQSAVSVISYIFALCPLPFK